MLYCPVQVEIVDPALQDQYNGYRYLLQVWKRGNKCYEKELKSPLTFWSINFDFLIFRTQNDEQKNFYQLVNLANQNSTLLIPANFKKDFEPIYATFNSISKIMFWADSKEILAMRIHSNFDNEEFEVYKPNKDDSQYINTGLKIHNLLLNKTCFEMGGILVVLETNEDYQLDFNRLLIEENGSFNFEQSREIVPRLSGRGVAMDPIVKCINNFPRGVHSGVALRKSGKVDLYFNQMRVDSPLDDNIREIGLSFDTFYFQLSNGEIKGLDHRNQGEFELIEAQKVTFHGFDFKKLYYQDIKNIVENLIIKHSRFSEEVSRVFRKKPKQGEASETAVLLNNGQMYVDIFNIITNPNNNNLQQAEVWDLGGQVTYFAMDTTFYEWGYALVREGENQYKLYAFNNSDKYEIEGITGINSNTKIIYIQNPDKDGSYLLVQQGINLSIYEQKQEIEKDDEGNVLSMGPPEMFQMEAFEYEELHNKKNPNQKVIIHSAATNDIKSYLFFADYNSMHILNIKKKKFKEFKHHNCNMMQVLDEKYIYTLSRQSEQNKTSSGLRFYDMKQIVETKMCSSYLLQNVQVGVSSMFDYSPTNCRLIFINSFDQISVIPPVHRNNFPLLGLSKKYKVIETRQMGNYFIVLNNQNELITWNILSGKPIQKVKLENQDYSNYVIFQDYDSNETDETTYTSGQYNKTLLVCNDPQENYKDEDFYASYQIQNTTVNQKLYIQTKDHEYYRFKLIELLNQNEVKEHITFILPYYTHRNVKQELFFSSNHQFMLERLSEGRVYLYESQPLHGNEVKWILKRKLFKFPDNFLNGSPFLTTVSQDFSKYLDIDRKTQRFKIMDLQDQNFITYIPDDLMKIQKKVDPMLSVNRFMFLDGQTFRIVNEEGFEKIVQFTNTIVDEELQQSAFQELEFNKIPLFTDVGKDFTNIDSKKKHLQDQKLDDEYKKSNYFTNRKQVNTNDIQVRLQRKYQAYKSAYYLFNRKTPAQMYQHLFTVDNREYLKTSQFYVDFSFTYLHWTIIEQIEAGELKVERIDGDTLELLLFNILPGGNTILHRLCMREDQLKEVFYKAHPNDQDVTEMNYHIPLLPNLNGDSPLHLCNQQQDYKSMDTMIKYLAAYPIDHHSRAINDLMPVFVEQNLPEFPNYLDSRLKQTGQLSVIDKGCLKLDSLGIITSQIWFERQEFDNKLMRPKPIEARIKCEFIDCPNIFNFKNETSQGFFEALADTDNMDLFQRKSIRKIVTYNFPPVRQYTVNRLFLPYCFFMILYVSYMNLVYEDRLLNETYMMFNVIFQILLIICATYFLQNEVRQLFTTGIEYLASIWNYIDIIPPILIYVTVGIDILELMGYSVSVTFLRSVLAIATFFMWFKLLYFMRIFRNTAYLIRMIICVIYDMRIFLLVLTVTLFAFGDSWLSISYGNAADAKMDDGETPARFMQNLPDSFFFTYRMILGDFDTGAFGNVAVPLCQVFFILCSVFNMIVMMNLLIAIISETFAQVNQNAENASYQEMAAMISENAYLIPDSVLHHYDLKDKYLLVVTDLDQEQSLVKEPLRIKMASIKRKIMKRFDEIHDEFSERKLFEQQVMKLLKQIAPKGNSELMSQTSSHY